MTGPYIGQPANATPPVPVREADLQRLETIMRGYGLRAGSGGAVKNRNPLHNLFARVDADLSFLYSRAVLWLSDVDAENVSFAREVSDPTFALSSQATTTDLGIRTGALQLHTALPRRGGGHNELFVSRRSTRIASIPEDRQPIVTVEVPGAADGTVISLVTGTPIQAQGPAAVTRSTDLRDNLTLPLGHAHVVSVGFEAEQFHLRQGPLPEQLWHLEFPEPGRPAGRAGRAIGGHSRPGLRNNPAQRRTVRPLCRRFLVARRRTLRDPRTPRRLARR